MQQLMLGKGYSRTAIQPGRSSHRHAPRLPLARSRHSRLVHRSVPGIQPHLRCIRRDRLLDHVRFTPSSDRIADIAGGPGFRISDFMVAPLKAYFMHVNARHHSVALVAAPVRSMHHLLVEYYQLDDVGQGYDLLQSTPEKIVATLGRHPNDLMTSYYMRTPSDIYVECGWGGKEVDDATPPVEMTNLGSFWGHKGLFEDIGAPTPRAEDAPRPGSGDGRQLRTHGRHLPVVGRNARQRALKRHRGDDDDQPDEFGHLQKSLNLPGDNSVYRTVCWMLRWPK